jgi:hypothetical protein
MYIVAQKQTVPELIELVNQLMNEGYIPLGGITFDRINLPTQTMIMGPDFVPKKRKKTND